MNSALKKILAVLAAVFILSVAYYGSYLPLRKSQAFIDALRNLRSAKSLAEFEQTISTPLDMPSPIGQEELVRNSANVILGLVRQNDKPEIIAEVVSYIENYYKPVIDRGVGMSFEQNLYILGAINEMAFVKTKDVKYFAAAKKYYSEGLGLGPKRPQFLYGMFDIYRIEGNVDGVKAIAGQILSQWPGDDSIKQGLSSFLSQVLTNRK
jgi:hypothetical protein